MQRPCNDWVKSFVPVCYIFYENPQLFFILPGHSVILITFSYSYVSYECCFKHSHLCLYFFSFSMARMHTLSVDVILISTSFAHFHNIKCIMLAFNLLNAIFNLVLFSGKSRVQPKPRPDFRSFGLGALRNKIFGEYN